MSLDPRTPVIVGVGQVTHRPARDDPATLTDPLALMAAALELAASDASGSDGRRSALLDRLDELTAVPSFVWHVADPALMVADRLGVNARATRVAFAGGTTPQTLVFDAARRIQDGTADVIAIVGAEAMRSRHLARTLGASPPWPDQDDAVPAAPVYGEVPQAMTDAELEAGLVVPAHSYALFEHAIRRDRSMDRDSHRQSLGELASRMSGIATTNPHAWMRTAVSSADVIETSASNRPVALPYSKLLTSNVIVDMGAAAIVCSLDAARAASVPEDRLVFPVEGAVAREQWFVSSRKSLARSSAMHACARALAATSDGAGGVSHLDLYSCFPAVVQMAGDALGIDVWRDERAPSVTGGMTFFGGPGNNYVTHSLASMVDALRARPGDLGLVTALGWYCSTHAWGTYSTTPPVRGFVSHDVQAVVDAIELRTVDQSYTGPAEVETYTVVYDRSGDPQRSIVSVLSPSGSRRVLASTDEVAGRELVAADPLGTQVSVGEEWLTLR